MISLIVGLGNPGTEYSKTRHNAGFWFVDAVAQQFNASFSDKKKFHGQIATAETAQGQIQLAKPATFMNASGRCVQPLMAWRTLKPEQLLVVHDELDLPVGSVRCKLGGGHGGHNGLRDIIRCLGSNDFIRLRIGIGHPGHASKVLGYVLKKPSVDERIGIDNAIDRTLALLPEWQQGNWPQVMQQLHSLQ